MTVSIHRVEASELDLLHALRLESLQESPGSFGSTYAIEAQRDPSSRLPWVTQGIAVVAVDDDGWHGFVTGTMTNEIVNVFAMWVRPDRRREGIGRLLLDAVLEWGKAQGASTAKLGVVDNNAAAAALYRSYGFNPTGEREALRSDDSREVIYLSRVLE